ncbi:TetR/AcrR family transcriptional regulator [Streptomyces sp. ACA25]|uniref:TetR/AcrR family transcriptional regulator n=1 Tax=Streptomyces sp. ACA25 TaxID=3022596 RepID=UPI00230798C3|nr:TetR/AcrR family transcriptional regulator [Streptomyces sp. ACA25]MDB1089983.1 TetR/AcrR family transcriptional regulator [Streptomyces sp. ACA25]
MAQQRRQRPSLTAEDWAEAALSAIREGGGLSAVAVEPLAVRLGATKGSFYWHFANREALVDAALARWEQQATDAVIARLAEEPEPAVRLRRLFAVTSLAAAEDPVEPALLAQAGHPRVAAALHRVVLRRLDYLTELFSELGFTPDEARRRSLHAYSGYLGHAQLAHAVPEVLPRGPEARTYLDGILRSLLSPVPSPGTAEATDTRGTGAEL